MIHLHKREFWNNAEAERLPDAWRLTKVQDDRFVTAVCEVWAVEIGWDLRLQIEGRGLQTAALCRSSREMVDRAEEWRAMLRKKAGNGAPCETPYARWRRVAGHIDGGLYIASEDSTIGVLFVAKTTNREAFGRLCGIPPEHFDQATTDQLRSGPYRRALWRR